MVAITQYPSTQRDFPIRHKGYRRLPRSGHCGQADLLCILPCLDPNDITRLNQRCSVTYRAPSPCCGIISSMIGVVTNRGYKISISMCPYHKQKLNNE